MDLLHQNQICGHRLPRLNNQSNTNPPADATTSRPQAGHDATDGDCRQSAVTSRRSTTPTAPSLPGQATAAYRLHHLHHPHATTSLLAGIPVHVAAAPPGHAQPGRDLTRLLPLASRTRHRCRGNLSPRPSEQLLASVSKPGRQR
jgi:hypothetical protein